MPSVKKGNQSKLDAYMDIINIIKEISFIVLGSILTLLTSWWVERVREKKKKIIFVKRLFISLLNNHKELLREKKLLKNRINKGIEAMLRSKWPIIILDSYDYRNEIHVLLGKSKHGHSIIDLLYNVNIYLEHIIKMRNHKIPIFEKIKPHVRERLKENVTYQEMHDSYNGYIKFIEIYLLEASNLIESLKKYAKEDLRINLSAFSLEPSKNFIEDNSF